MADDFSNTSLVLDALTPASKNVWYALATIAGEPNSYDDADTIFQNRHYWNGYMRTLMSDDAIRTIENLIEPTKLPKLRKGDAEHISNVLKERGFPAGRPTDRRVISFSNLELPNVSFSGFVFPRPVSFSKSTFSDWVDFERACFQEDLSAVHTKFLELAIFTKSSFIGEADFKKAIFSNGVQFDEVKFSHSISFYDTEFQWADFLNSSFDMHANFGKASFDGTVSFRNTNFMGGLYFNEANFKSEPPKFYGAKISEEISWTKTKFPPNRQISIEVADSHKDAYERISLMMDKLNKHHDQHKFYRLEMQMRRQMESKWSIPRFINWAYFTISDYGYGVSRTICIWGGNIFFGALLLGVDKSYTFAAPTWDNLKVFFALTKNATITSFSNAHGFLGLGRGPLKETIAAYQKNTDLLIPYNCIAIVQTIFGVVFLFFLLLTLRNKFKMG